MSPERKTALHILPEQIAAIAQRLENQQRIRRQFAEGGHLHIERPLPFLCIYRKTDASLDGTRKLAIAEPAHIITAPHLVRQRSFRDMVTRIIEIMSRQFGRYLVLELWTQSVVPTATGELEPVVYSHRSGTEIADYLTEQLSRLRLAERLVEAHSAQVKRIAPPYQVPLLNEAELDARGGTLLGMSLPPIWIGKSDQQFYPMIMREVQRKVGRILRRTFYHFTRTQTTHRPAHYHVLGRQAVAKPVWRMDQALAEVADRFDFLLLVTPINARAAWNAFRKSGYQTIPTFRYYPLPIDPVLLKRQLHAAPLERVNDPALWQLFREKLWELDQQISMLSKRNNRQFLLGSQQLYGPLKPDLVELAAAILQRIGPRVRERNQGEQIDAERFAERARQEVKHYQEQYKPFTGRVAVRDDLASGLLVTHGQLLIDRELKMGSQRAEALLHHEVGTHMVTYYNATAQPFVQLRIGLAGYESLQEGLAVLAEYLCGQLSRPRLRLLAGRVMAVHLLLSGADFVETFRVLHLEHRFERRTAFNIAMRVFRGGGLTKDAIYLQGLRQVLEYLSQGGDLSPLLIGKTALEHLPIIRELLWREVLAAPPLLPRYLQTELARQRLDYLRSGASVLDLIERTSK